MTFQDIFKSSFLESVTEFSVLDTVLGLSVSLVLGLFIFLIYKKTLTGVLYSSGFALTLVGLSLVTTLVIMAVTSNVVLSLGMVGSGLIPLAVIGSAVISIILLLFGNRKVRENPYILVLNCQDEAAESDVHKALAQMVQHYNVKSKTVTATGIELTAELRAKDASTAFVNSIQSIPGVGSATLVSYNGEYMG